MMFIVPLLILSSMKCLLCMPSSGDGEIPVTHIKTNGQSNSNKGELWNISRTNQDSLDQIFDGTLFDQVLNEFFPRYPSSSTHPLVQKTKRVLGPLNLLNSIFFGKIRKEGKLPKYSPEMNKAIDIVKSGLEAEESADTVKSKLPPNIKMEGYFPKNYVLIGPNGNEIYCDQLANTWQNATHNYGKRVTYTATPRDDVTPQHIYPTPPKGAIPPKSIGSGSGGASASSIGMLTNGTNEISRKERDSLQEAGRQSGSLSESVGNESFKKTENSGSQVTSGGRKLVGKDLSQTTGQSGSFSESVGNDSFKKTENSGSQVTSGGRKSVGKDLSQITGQSGSFSESGKKSIKSQSSLGSPASTGKSSSTKSTSSQGHQTKSKASENSHNSGSARGSKLELSSDSFGKADPGDSGILSENKSLKSQRQNLGLSQKSLTKTNSIGSSKRSQGSQEIRTRSFESATAGERSESSHKTKLGLSNYSIKKGELHEDSAGAFDASVGSNQNFSQSSVKAGSGDESRMNKTSSDCSTNNSHQTHSPARTPSSKTRLKSLSDNRSEARTPSENRSQARTPSENRSQARTLSENRSQARTLSENRSEARTPSKNRSEARILSENKSEARTLSENKSEARTPSKNRSEARTLSENKSEARIHSDHTANKSRHSQSGRSGKGEDSNDSVLSSARTSNPNSRPRTPLLSMSENQTPNRSKPNGSTQSSKSTTSTAKSFQTTKSSQTPKSSHRAQTPPPPK